MLSTMIAIICVRRFNTSTGNPVNEILLKLNLPDHRSILTDLKISIKDGHGSLFSGIPIDSSLTLSHIFFVDDAIFVGKWDSLNIRTIINVLKCLHLASGLKINFHKSKHIGIVTRPEEVNSAATKIGCSIFTIHFVHLGVKVGGVISRIKSWDDVVAKVSSRLSKWKLKPLSIGGRLTLIKSVLTSIPLYHMYIFKVPSGVLKLLESIRRNFSNGVDKSKRKMAWVSWNKVLASKKYGGLGVSTIYGEDGALNSSSSLSKRSSWLDIIRPMRWWELEDIDLASYDDWLLWLNSSRLSKRLKEFLEGVCYVKWWFIWRFRNQLLFGATNPCRELLFDDLVQKKLIGVLIVVILN
ncbi:hypothetical protein Tco_0664805 [Tanacetum coccineum]